MPFRIAALLLRLKPALHLYKQQNCLLASPRIISKLGTIGNVLNMSPTEPGEYRIDLILGADHYSQVMGKRTPLRAGLEAYRTPFGIVLHGPVPGPGLACQGVHNKQIRGNACLLATPIGCMDYVDTEIPGDAVSLLHSLDAISLGETVSKTEDPAAIHFRSTVERLQEG